MNSSQASEVYGSLAGLFKRANHLALRFFKILWILNYNGEFDSGSERTLAARLKHASRTICSNTGSGGRVRNT